MPLPSSSRTRLVAILALASAVFGCGLGAWLTYVKFRREFLCDGIGCLGGGASLLSCDQALDSTWAAFLGVPWSQWASAHAIVVAVFAAAILRSRGAWARVAPRALLGLGAAAAAISTVLFFYAWTHFDHLCRLCVCLYAYSLLTLGAGLLLRDAPREPLAFTATLRGATLLLALVTAQTLTYRLAARSVQCPGLAPELPAAALVTPVKDPRHALLLFVDPSCELCRELHHLLQQPRLQDVLGTVEQRVYLVPRALCDEHSLLAHEFVDAAGNELSNDAARHHDACIAARVLYCIEKLTPGVGPTALEAAFRLQDSRAGFAYFDFEALVAALRNAGALSGPVDTLRSCVDGEDVARDIADAQRYLRDWVQAHGGRLGLPQAFVVPVVGGRLDMQQAWQARDAEKIFHILRSSAAEP